jgi:hypothetical protein
MSTRRQFISTSVGLGSIAGLADALAMGQKPLQSGIRRIKGDVRLNGSPARVDQAVLPGDTIATGANSEVLYVMANNAYLMRDNSVIQFVQDGAVGVLRLITGKVLAVFGPGPKRLETPAATIGIRGTACYMETMEAKLYFCLCYGTADIQPLADATQARTLTTQYHDAPLYIGREAGRHLMEPAPVINHRDLELIMLEEAVGRQPPFMQRANRDSNGY